MACVWGYFSGKSGGGIHEFCDSQVGKGFLCTSLRVSKVEAFNLKVRGYFSVECSGAIHEVCLARWAARVVP